MPSITLSFSDATAARIQTALTELVQPKDEIGNDRPANAADAKKYLRDHLKHAVVEGERILELRARETNEPDIT